MKRIEAYYPAEILTRFGSTIPEAGSALSRAVDTFVAGLSRLPAEQLHLPIEGGWSVAEYADHLYRTHLLYVTSIERVRAGADPIGYPMGALSDAGGMIAPDEVHPVSGRQRDELIADLRSSTATLIATVEAALEAGMADTVCNVNPYFGPVTALGSVQLAAAHCRHHTRKHLDKVLAQVGVAP